ncbi:uncharacterized protein FIBRA_09022 [Fibroporia radiculosa]|uniref:DUF5127 domain-containing protein n=1 Tax=Fibroporia radiculosa TaxID=599839 RepID=J4GIQ2_9APHY|nr:uncharacterized protein FIBRA_09022 [Fibroporia radiculosa]CCM06728.1 predicted protein [Fibroporia radiculosa]
MWAFSLGFLLLLALVHPIYGAASPPSVPLAVRSPYLSTWLTPGSTALSASWPSFWNGHNLGWTGFVNVDGASYVFMGTPDVPNTTFKPSVQTPGMEITSTQSIFTMTAGPVELTVRFLSPVEPSDLVNQSLPFSYFAVSAQSVDDKSHEVQVYSDISGGWLSSNSSMTVNWTTSVENAIIHQVQLENQTLFADVDDRIQQGSVYYATLNVS